MDPKQELKIYKTINNQLDCYLQIINQNKPDPNNNEYTNQIFSFIIDFYNLIEFLTKFSLKYNNGKMNELYLKVSLIINTLIMSEYEFNHKQNLLLIYVCALDS